MAREVRARCCWEVTAGVVPGTPEPEFTKRFILTEEDPGELFADRYNEAISYVATLTDPNSMNWVRLDWVWF